MSRGRDLENLLQKEIARQLPDSSSQVRAAYESTLRHFGPYLFSAYQVSPDVRGYLSGFAAGVQWRKSQEKGRGAR